MSQASKTYAGSALTATGDAAVVGNSLKVAAAASYDLDAAALAALSNGATPAGWTFVQGSGAGGSLTKQVNGSTPVLRLAAGGGGQWAGAHHSDTSLENGTLLVESFSAAGRINFATRYSSSVNRGYLAQVIPGASSVINMWGGLPSNFVGSTNPEFGHVDLTLAALQLGNVFTGKLHTNTQADTTVRVRTHIGALNYVDVVDAASARRWPAGRIALQVFGGTSDYSRIAYFPTKAGGFTFSVTPYSVTSVTRVLPRWRSEYSFKKRLSEVFEYRLTSGAVVGAWTPLPDDGYINAAVTTTIELRAVATLKNDNDATGDIYVDSLAMEIDGVWDAPAALNPPTNLDSTATGPNSADITWDDSPTGHHYILYQNTVNNSATATPVDAAFQGDEMASAEGLAAATQYFFWVKAVDAFGTVSAFSDPTLVTTDASGSPAIPDNVVVEAVDRETALVSCEALGSADFYHFHVAIVDDFAESTPAGLSEGDNPSFTVKGLTPGQQYFFFVTAENGFGRSGASDPAELTMPAALQASGLAVEQDGPGRLRLSWVDDPQSEDAAYIAYSAPSNNFALATQFNFLATGIQTAVKSGLGDATAAWFWVVAVDSLGFGPAVGPVTATTEAAPDGVIDWALLRAGLHAWAVSASGLPEERVIWRDSNGPKPLKSFVELNLGGPEKVGADDYQDQENLQAQRVVRLTIRVAADTKTVAMGLVHRLQTGFELEPHAQLLYDAAASFGEAFPAVDTTTPLENKPQPEFTFDATLFVSSREPSSVEQIDEAPVTGEAE